MTAPIRRITPLIRPTLAIALSVGLGVSSPTQAASVVTDWLDVAVPAAEHVAAEPPAAARFFAVLHTAMYEAWAAYDETAVGTVTGLSLKGAGGAPTVANKREAVSHAAYAALMFLAPEHRKPISTFLADQGYDPASQSEPAILGRRAAEAVIAMRRNDGSNQAGSYLDTSGYRPQILAPRDRWQPAATDLMANVTTLAPVAPHWKNVTPFALARAEMFRPPAPPSAGTPEFDAQVDEILRISANLTDEQKAIAEYWANFISSPPPHLIKLTKFVSLRDDLRLDDDVKLFFVVSNALHDAGISCWEAKYHYDYARPYSTIRSLGDQPVTAWDNPNLSAASNHLPNYGYSIDWGRPRTAITMPAKQWLPYLPTPPFPAYVSGHSQFTAAWARVMTEMTGSERFGFRAEWPKLFVENRWLKAPIVLDYPTYWSAAEASGLSRLYGGIHWRVDNEAGLAAGRQVGDQVWAVAQRYFNGSARPAWMAPLSLAPPVWQHRNAPDLAAADAATVTRDVADGLHIRFAQGNSGPRTAGWQTVVLDPLPAGRYRLAGMLKAEAADNATLSVRLGLIDPRASERLLAESETLTFTPHSASAPVSMPVEFTFQTDGQTAQRFAIDATAAGGGPASLILHKLDLRQLHSVAGQQASN